MTNETVAVELKRSELPAYLLKLCKRFKSRPEHVTVYLSSGNNKAPSSWRYNAGVETLGTVCMVTDESWMGSDGEWNTTRYTVASEPVAAGGKAMGSSKAFINLHVGYVGQEIMAALYEARYGNGDKNRLPSLVELAVDQSLENKPEVTPLTTLCLGCGHSYEMNAMTRKRVLQSTAFVCDACCAANRP